MKINSRVLLTGILILAAALRFWQLNLVPPSPDWDEVSYGYNAYSILKTGADEYGIKFPVILKSYDDYKPALYSYLSVPSVAVFGLNTFAVRFPNALFSLIGVGVVFFLARKLFRRDDIALLSSFLLAISPWHIQFSRFSHEAIVGVTLNVLFVLFLLKGLRNYKLLLLSAFLFALSFYSYQSEKLFAPLLGLLLFIVFFKDLMKVPKKFIGASVLVAMLVILPMLLFIKNDPKALSRAKGTSVFAHQTEILDLSAKKLIEDRESGNIPGLILNNRRVIYSEKIVQNYLSHFDPSWLFIKGDLPRHHPPGMGILYIWELPFLLLGIYGLTFGRLLPRKYKLFLIGWFLIAPIPAAFTFDVPHAARAMNILPVIQLISALGLVSFLEMTRIQISKNSFKVITIVISLLFLVNFSYYLGQYFTKLNYMYSSEWQFGYKEAVTYVNANKDKYEKIVVSNQVPLDQSYMFFLFYLKYPPEKYQKQGGPLRLFDKFEFRKINWREDSKLPNTLIVGSDKEIPKESRIKTINYLNGKPAIIISGTSK